jgi:hypothetical protein
MPTGLRNLKSLAICFCYPKKEDKSRLVCGLHGLVDVFASQSRLHFLKLKSRYDVKTHFRADRFMSMVLQRHGDTLRRLSLGEFHPSSLIFRKIFNCRYMRRLTIGITRTLAVGRVPFQPYISCIHTELQNDLPLCLIPTSRLEILTLYFPKETVRFSHSTVQALLRQTSSPLRTIKVNIVSKLQCHPISLFLRDRVDRFAAYSNNRDSMDGARNVLAI